MLAINRLKIRRTDECHPGELTLNELPLIAHVDKYLIKIANEPWNVASLSNCFERFRTDLGQILGCSAKEVSLKRIRRGTGPLCLTFWEGVSTVQVFPHNRLAGFVAVNKRFPDMDYMEGLRFTGRWIATVVITHANKWDYRAHLENLQTVSEFLESRLTVSPWSIEVALDTRDPALGIYMRQFCTFKRPPSYSQVFHIANGKKHAGPSKNGEDEYFGYRAKSMTDPRDNQSRPLGGRRQIFAYRRELERFGKKLGFYRFELRLYRGYLHKSRLTRCKDSRELLDDIESLAMRNLTFLSLDWQGIYRHFPAARFLKLERLSTKGQLARLYERGFTEEAIRPYLETMPTPDIFFVTDPIEEIERDNTGMALWTD